MRQRTAKSNHGDVLPPPYTVLVVVLGACAWLGCSSGSTTNPGVGDNAFAGEANSGRGGRTSFAGELNTAGGGVASGAAAAAANDEGGSSGTLGDAGGSFAGLLETAGSAFGGSVEAGAGGSGNGGGGGASGGSNVPSAGAPGGPQTWPCPSTNPICSASSYSDIAAKHTVPNWLKRAKFGIGMHFMVATVPAHINEWFFQESYCNNSYASWMSQNFPKTSPLSGGPWGYKDFIPLFTVERWSQPAPAHAATTAASWAALFKASGATFVNITAQHHDRFAMWDSAEPAAVGSAGTWNAMKMGPKRDIVGELVSAIKAQGLKVGVNNHIMYGYSFAYCGADGTTPGNVGPKTPASVSDLYDPRYAAFYGPPNPGCGVLGKKANGSCSPSKAFCDDWLYRSEELVDKYQLDNEWFDWDGAVQPNTPCYEAKLAFALHYYKNAAAWGKDVHIAAKGGVFPSMSTATADGANIAMTDSEGRVLAAGAVSPWMVDYSATETSWCYVDGVKTRSASNIIAQLDAANSRGGIFMLNLTPLKDGTIPPEQVAVLNAIGKHLGAPGNF